MNEKISKLLTLALHPNTPEHEAKNAGEKFISICRANKVTAADFTAAGKERIVYVTQYEAAPSKTFLTMPHGKYKGVNLDDLLERDVRYCEWAVSNMTVMPETIRSYLKRKLESCA